MSNPKYKAQVNILLTVLPAVIKEECFALHGGTAINLFVRDMPRFSVDIDLTYLPIEDRATTLKNIDEALQRIKERIQTILPRAQILYKEDTAKLAVRHDGEEIKIEVTSNKDIWMLQPYGLRIIIRTLILILIALIPLSALILGILWMVLRVLLLMGILLC